MTSRSIFTFLLIFSIALLGSAAYLQYIEGLEPCPMCIMQRWALITLCVWSLIAICHNPASIGQRIYGFGVVLITGTGVAIAGRQVWLQHLPANEVPECGPGFDYLLENFPLKDVLSYVFSGSGECAVIDWTFLGQSLALWSLVAFIFLALVGIFIVLRPNKKFKI
jgi:disulfide bond formation protein DsbB